MYNIRLCFLVVLFSFFLVGNALAKPSWGPSCSAASCHGTPVVTDFQLPSSHDALTVPINSFTATDGDPQNKTKVDGYMLTTSPTIPGSGDAGWQNSPPTEYTFSADGLQTLYAWAKDSFGGVSGAVSDAVEIIIAIPNKLPTADAGPDQSVQEGDVVTLDGTNSIDDDGSLVQFFWEQTGGEVLVALSDPYAEQPFFDAPVVGLNGASLTFTLTVTDDAGDTHSDTCIVNISNVNVQPVADAGPDQTVAEGLQVQLDGSGSSGVDDAIASYLWQQINITGAIVTLNDATIANPYFVLDGVGAQGESVTLQLTVTDEGGSQATDTVVINITNVNQPPVAVTGGDQSVMAGDLVSLDASGSSDPDGPLAIDAYTWKQTAGTAVTLSDPGATNPAFTAPAIAAGTTDTLIFELTVTDGLLQATATCNVVVAAVNEPPADDPPADDPPADDPPADDPPADDPPADDPPADDPPADDPPADDPPADDPPVDDPPADDPPADDPPADDPPADDPPSDGDNDAGEGEDGDHDDGDDDGDSYDDDDDDEEDREHHRKKRRFKRWLWSWLFSRFDRD